MAPFNPSQQACSSPGMTQNPVEWNNCVIFSMEDEHRARDMVHTVGDSRDTLAQKGSQFLSCIYMSDQVCCHSGREERINFISHVSQMPPNPSAQPPQEAGLGSLPATVQTNWEEKEEK
ncbi:hypothetical protein JZ751_011176 [Albula glossodonta]|uniref:Uncharacterized protein n=1 Tax=Albula glossodonta TaxID=121402 RepID=A0A8T2NYA4_9TELE|nr:hypothetical protein JZ751_011176 [Albula glossodonta]